MCYQYHIRTMKSNNYKRCSIALFLLQVVYFDEWEYFQQGYVWIPLPWKQTYKNGYILLQYNAIC